MMMYKVCRHEGQTPLESSWFRVNVTSRDVGDDGDA